MANLDERIAEATSVIQGFTQMQPQMAIILGSGLSGLADLIRLECAIPYAEIPHFKVSGAPGHLGRLLFGELAGLRVVCMQGRLHYYEGNSPEEIVFPLQVMHALGAQTLLVTNAAGGINLGFDVGDIMLITDHINLTATNPLTLGDDQGLHDFIDMSYTYTRELQERALNVAHHLGIGLRQGTYLGVRGPNFETPAEIRAFRVLGADAVGMSTVFEVLAARQRGMQIIGLSLITNMAAGILDQPLSGEEVLETSARAASRMEALVTGLLENLAAEPLA